MNGLHYKVDINIGIYKWGMWWMQVCVGVLARAQAMLIKGWSLRILIDISTVIIFLGNTK